MPRAFLITNRRYGLSVDHHHHWNHARDSSPERRVWTADGMDVEASENHFLLHPASPHSPANLCRRFRDSPPLHHDWTPSTHSAYGQVEPLVLTVPKSRVATNLPNSESSEELQQGDDLFHSPNLKYHGPASFGIADCWNREDSDGSSSSSIAEEESALALTADAHACPECGKKYSTSSNLARHRQTHRSSTDRKARKCPHCEKVYVSMPAFSMHVRTHSQGCQCPFCGKSFSRPWLLQGHIRTHTGEKPFKCPVCSKAFADKSNLRAHIQTHSSSKPHVCQRCGKAFALKSYLYKHEESSCMRLNRQQHAPQRTPSIPVHV